MILSKVYNCTIIETAVYYNKKGGADMPVSKAQMKATNKYNAANYDSLRIVVPKGRKTTVEAYAKAQGESVNGLVNALLREKLNLSEEEWKRSVEE